MGDQMIAIHEKLKKKHAERLASIEQRRQVRLKKKEENNETSEAFLKTFNEEKRCIVGPLNTMHENIPKIELTSQFNLITQKMQTLQKFVSDSSVFLPSYDVRRAQEILLKLRNDINDKREKLLPKKKFAFKSRQRIVPKDKQSETVSQREVGSAKESTYLQNLIGFQNQCDQTFTMNDNEVSGKDLSLLELENCTVYLLGNPAALQIKNLLNTTVYCGPVSSAIYINDCLDCTFHLACQQLRIHSTLSSKFYIHVTSKAIIEDCEDVGFACLTWTYEKIHAHYLESGLDRKANNWKEVDDFNWLKLDEQSPNWFIIDN